MMNLLVHAELRATNAVFIQMKIIGKIFSEIILFFIMYPNFHCGTVITTKDHLFLILSPLEAGQSLGQNNI